MKTLSLSEVESRFSEIVAGIERRDEAITITRQGKTVAVMLSRDAYEGWLETTEILQDREFLAEIMDSIRSLARTRKRYTVAALFSKE